MGIDLSIEGRAARNRRGVAIIIHGPPLSGKTRAASILSKYYECAVLSIDNIIIDALSNNKSSAALKARQLCAEAAKNAEDQRIEGTDKILVGGTTGGMSNSTGATGLSVEALAQHSLNRMFLCLKNLWKFIFYKIFTHLEGSVAMSKKTSVAGDSHTKGKKKADSSDLVPNQVIILNRITSEFSINIRQEFNI